MKLFRRKCFQDKALQIFAAFTNLLHRRYVLPNDSASNIYANLMVVYYDMATGKEASFASGLADMSAATKVSLPGYAENLGILHIRAI